MSASLIAQRYRLDRIIGRGGMGEVWLAEDTVLGRQVAAKRLRAREASEEELTRSRREATVTAMLDDEHVVRVFDLVADGDDQWLVMELVESENLAHLVRRVGPLDPTTAARLVHQAALALAAAHSAGIVHRDVKPSNLLVTASGHVKLGDFGIARLVDDVGTTRTGQLVGSPGYLAPEVASGRSASSASDLWSLGATLFHAVEGHPPYETSDGNVIGTLYRVVNEPPPPMRHGGWLTPLVGNLMVHDPAQRWTAQQVTTYLERALAQAPNAYPVPPARRDPGAAVADADTPAGHTSALPVVPPARPAAAARRPQPKQRSPRTRRRPSGWAMASTAVVVLLVVLVAVVVTLALRNRGDTPAAGSSPSASGTPSTAPTTATRAGMVSFIEDYLATAPRDPDEAYTRLTPRFQRESGELPGYRGFWGTIASATPSGIETDPDSMTVKYDVAYRLDNGSRTTDTVRLSLDLSDGKYLIAGEVK